MGRALIFIVLAAAVGAGTLTLSAQRSRTAADARHAENQADLLAREIAEAGHNAALRAMVTPAGLTDPTVLLGAEQDYSGGRFQIAYTPGSTTDEATVRVSGAYGGAVHTAERTYVRTTFDAPGPLWLDVPAATTHFDASASVGGGPVAYDPRQHEAMGIEDVRPMAALRTDLAAAASAVGSTLSAPAADAWASPDGPLGGVNAADAAALYRRAVAAKGAGDETLAGAQTVAGTAAWGLASETDKITHVDGDLTVTGRLTGHGALVVDGDLRVPGELDWSGMVLVHGTGPDLVVDLSGVVAVDGMLVVSHDVAPTLGNAPAALVDAVRARLAAARPFGAAITLGPDVALRYDRDALRALGQTLRFDGDGVRIVASSEWHTTAAEARAAGGAPAGDDDDGPSADDDGPSDDGPAPYNPNTATQPPDGMTPIPSTPLAGPPGQKHDVCHWDPVGGYQNKQEKPDKVILHLLHLSDYLGKCTDAHKAIDPLSF